MRSVINNLAEQIFDWACEKGWWDSYPQTRHQTGKRLIQLNADQIASKLMLATSELAEALEVIRNPDASLTGIEMVGGKPEGFGIELADCIIRILDLSAALDIDIGHCIAVKMGYNQTRPYRHGGKAI